MPNPSPRHNLQLPILAFALGVVFLLMILSLATTVAAQDIGASGTTTPEPTNDDGLNIPPTFAFATPTRDPTQIPSLTGVGGQAVNAAVVIRSGPGLSYPQI